MACPPSARLRCRTPPPLQELKATRDQAGQGKGAATTQLRAALGWRRAHRERAAKSMLHHSSQEERTGGRPPLQLLHRY
eukprot:10647477-Alexandrium_andersonii.AAC.1